MTHFDIYHRAKGEPHEGWRKWVSEKELSSAITEAKRISEEYAVWDVVVLEFAHRTSPFWQGKVVWESPGAGCKPNEEPV